ncbi:phosphoglycerate mutase [Dictyobacter vulcani]|uniref:Phosphoglycerate mutase n=1 Tax=Dictyobacter vulcani TaxID=2607529 RepID=A0A5J4KL60_9CHLR|nr:histidine phosphatase family protein [Dictyobacter vulcani]GER90448.1 phosphoglycerate mutase [Dictyobacter vulcani]
MTHIYLIRHGDNIEALKDGKYQDLGLSEDGIRQTERLRDRLARTGEIKVDVLISSPLQRAQESARILAPVLGQPIVLDQDFEEWRCEDGSMTPEEFTARWKQVPDEQKPFYRWQDGYETGQEFSLRVQSALKRIIEEHAGKTVVLISHGGIVGAAFTYFFGLNTATLSPVSIAARNTSITHWHKAEHASKWALERYNDYQHL